MNSAYFTSFCQHWSHTDAASLMPVNCPQCLPPPNPLTDVMTLAGGSNHYRYCFVSEEAEARAMTQAEGRVQSASQPWLLGPLTAHLFCLCYMCFLPAWARCFWTCSWWWFILLHCFPMDSSQGRKFLLRSVLITKQLICVITKGWWNSSLGISKNYWKETGEMA